MNVWQYFLPESSVAGLVLVLLLALFIVWCALFLRWARSLSRERREIESGSDVNLLSEFLGRDDGGAAVTRRSAEAREREAAAVFHSYCAEKGLREQSPVALHVKAIFDAGLKNARLDVGDITRHTAGELFKPYSLLRSVLAVFIIVGLLGTLTGLAASLAHLAPPTTNGAAQSATELSQGLGRLLSQLKSAFAPSIWGVLLTLFGVLLLSFYMHLRALPVRKELERVTFTVWVPRLFQSTSQQFLTRLYRSEQQMQQSLQVVREMAEFSSLIQAEVVGFRNNLQGANEPLSLIAKSSQRLNKFNDKFAQSVGALTSFQAELQALYAKMVEDSASFHESVRKNIRESAEFQQNVQTELRGQGEYIRSLMTTMKSYEESYVRERGRLDAHLMELLSEAKKAYSALVGLNRDLVKEVGDPLRKDLKTGLGAVGKNLQRGLEEIHTKLGGLDVSVADAAKELGSTSRAMRDHADAMAGGLREQAEEQTRAGGEQLGRIEAANREIVRLLSDLSALNRSQSESASRFSGAVAELAGNVVSMSEGVAALTRAAEGRGAATHGGGFAARRDSRPRRDGGAMRSETAGAWDETGDASLAVSGHESARREEGGDYHASGRVPRTDAADGAAADREGAPAEGDHGRPQTASGQPGEGKSPDGTEPGHGLLGFLAKYK